MRYPAKLRFVAGLIAAIAIVSWFLIWQAGWLGPLSLKREQADFWDIAFKGIGGFVAVAGSALALSKYFDEKSKENRAALIEAQKPFYTKRQEIYYELVSATSTIANRVRDDPIRDQAQIQFWQLSWGVVPMVADEQVAKAIDIFTDAFTTSEDGQLLRNKSMDLARACRKSLGFVSQT
jgi:hypothetical protein